MRILDVVMRILIWGTALAVISNGCTTINIMTEKLQSLSYVDSALVSYVDRFKQDAKDHGISINTKKLTLVFGSTKTDDSPTTIGTCSPIQGYPVVTIDSAYWNVSDDLEREELVYHELGHCLLGRDHCEVKENGVSVSMMEPEMIGSVVYSKHRKALIDELFNSHPGCGEIGEIPNGVHVRLRKR